MKIISKFKDYYDFLQGKYGIDELKVLDRTLSKEQPYSEFDKDYDIIFCNTRYVREKINDWFYKNHILNNNKYEFICNSTDNYAWFKVNEFNNLKYPIYCKRYDKEHYNFCLKNVKFNEVLSPEQCYLTIEEFLGKIKEEVPQTIPTDLDRFQAKGFDKKTSFRKM